MQMSLVHESITDALREAINACGGNKKKSLHNMATRIETITATAVRRVA